jgi:hypothetical protein
VQLSNQSDNLLTPSIGEFDDSFFGESIELVNAEVISVIESILCRIVDRHGSFNTDGISFSSALALALVIDGSFDNLVNVEFERFSAEYRDDGLRSNSESQSDKKLPREFSSSDVILQVDFNVILNHILK